MATHFKCGAGTAENVVIAGASVPANTVTQTNDEIKLFSRTVTLTSAAAATAVPVIRTWEVGSGRKIYITGMFYTINGATNWATTATITLENLDGTDLATITVAAGTTNGNITGGFGLANVKALAALFTGGTANSGLQLIADANGTGSDLIMTVTGYIK